MKKFRSTALSDASAWAPTHVNHFSGVPKIDVLMHVAAGPAAAWRRRVRLSAECGRQSLMPFSTRRRAVSRTGSSRRRASSGIGGGSREAEALPAPRPKLICRTD